MCHSDKRYAVATSGIWHAVKEEVNYAFTRGMSPFYEEASAFIRQGARYEFSITSRWAVVGVRLRVVPGFQHCH